MLCLGSVTCGLCSPALGLSSKYRPSNCYSLFLLRSDFLLPLRVTSDTAHGEHFEDSQRPLAARAQTVLLNLKQ